ncbi:MAG: hypothetical protein ACI8PZ_003946 [Myxococcota bacterium]|jgi:hypothetical protein
MDVPLGDQRELAVERIEHDARGLAPESGDLLNAVDPEVL